MYLNVWSPVRYLERIRKCDLVGGGVSLRLSFEISNTHKAQSVSVSLCLCLYFTDNVWTLSCCSSIMPACLPLCSPAMILDNLTLWNYGWGINFAPLCSHSGILSWWWQKKNKRKESKNQAQHPWRQRKEQVLLTLFHKDPTLLFRGLLLKRFLLLFFFN